jgi:pimeloyl-ACP methyl ester carboxylesterase
MRNKILTTLLTCALALNAMITSAEPFSDRITVTVRGHGPDVLLIPGLTCSIEVWDATAKQLEGRYRLHLVQVAGFAGTPSGGNASGPVLQPMVNALDAYIKTNKLMKPRVIGHSLGGLMGMMLCLQHPEDCSKLMVVDALPFFGALMGARDAAGAEAQAAAMRDKILTETQDDYAQGEKRFLTKLVKSPEGLKLVTQWAIDSDKAVVAQATYEDMTTDLRPKLPEIKTPITVLYPWDSAHGFAESATASLYEGNFAALPNKKLVRIPNSFHFIMLDQPEAFASQVNAFLK